MVAQMDHQGSSPQVIGTCSKSSGWARSYCDGESFYKLVGLYNLELVRDEIALY